MTQKSDQRCLPLGDCDCKNCGKSWPLSIMNFLAAYAFVVKNRIFTEGYRIAEHRLKCALIGLLRPFLFWVA